MSMPPQRPPEAWQPRPQQNQMNARPQHGGGQGSNFAYFANQPQNPQHSPPRVHQGDPRPPMGKRGRGTGPKLILIVLLILGLGLGGYFAITSIQNQQVKDFIAPYQDVYGPNIFINGLDIGGLTPEEALGKLKADIQRNIDSWSLALEYEGHTYANLNYSLLGLAITDEQLYPLLNEAWALTHMSDEHQVREALLDLGQNRRDFSTAKAEANSAQLDSWLQQIAQYINRNPQDAFLVAFHPDEENPFVIQDEQYGAQLDVEAARNEILHMAANGQSGVYTFNPVLTAPQISRSDVEKTVKLRTTITTDISTSSPSNRNHNIVLSFSKFNGMILKPGATFSFNRVVGPRTEEAGFAEAEEYAYGNLVYGIGGGVCQASTTLYQAALTANLEIKKRLPHSGPVDYTKLGQDATVFLSKDREIDFQFVNTTAGNIYITAHVKPARRNSKRLVSEISMYGLDLGDGISFGLRSDVVQTLPIPDTKKYETDEQGIHVTYRDEEKLKTKGREGQIIETYLEKYQHGVLIEQPKLINRDTFAAKEAVYWRGRLKR